MVVADMRPTIIRQGTPHMARHLKSAATILATLLASPAAAQTLPLAEFDSIELNGGGTVDLRYGPVQRVTLAEGSTEYTRIRVKGREVRRSGRSTVVDDGGRLVIDACNQRCPRRYHLRVVIETPDIDAVAVKGGGEIVAASGFPQQESVAAAVHGGGEIDLRALAVTDVAGAVHGGGRLLVRPQAALAASVNGGGEILYWGNPSVVTSINGGGGVRRGD